MNRLRWWNNKLGHYRPANSSTIQAGLPIDKFEEKQDATIRNFEVIGEAIKRLFVVPTRRRGRF